MTLSGATEPPALAAKPTTTLLIAVPSAAFTCTVTVTGVPLAAEAGVAAIATIAAGAAAIDVTVNGCVTDDTSAYGVAVAVAVAVRVFWPTVFPTVHVVVATPAMFVVTGDGATLPPPAEIAMATLAPLMELPLMSVTVAVTVV